MAALIGVSVLAALTINGLLAFQNRVLTKKNLEITKLSNSVSLSAEKSRQMQIVAEESERQIKGNLYAADINRAAAAWRDNDTRVVRELLERHIPKAGELDHRGFEWWFLHRQVGRAHHTLLDTGTPLYILMPSPDKRLMAVAGFDAIVRLFDPQTGEIAQEISTGQIEVNGLAFSSDGKELATAGDDGTIRCWNLSTGVQRLKIHAHPGKAYQLFFTPDNSEIVSCGDNPVIRVFDSQTGEERLQLEGHVRDVQSLSLGFDKTSFVSTSMDDKAYLWTLNSKVGRMVVNYGEPLGPVVLLDDRDLVLVGSTRGYLLSSRISSELNVSVVKHQDGVDSIAVHPNGKLIAIGTSGGGIRLWNLGPKGELTESDSPPWQAHQGTVYYLAWSEDGSRLISTGKDGRVISWNLPAIQFANIRKLAVPAPSSFCTIPKTEILFHSQDPSHSAVMSAMKWRTDTRLTTLSANENHVLDFVASSDGRLLAGLRAGQELHLFQVEITGKGLPDLKHLSRWVSPGTVRSLRFSPDSSSIAVPQWFRHEPDGPIEHYVWLLSVPDLEQRERIPVPNTKAMEFSPDGKHLLLTGHTGLTLWNLKDRNITWNVPRTEQNYLAFSNDGRFVATGGDDRLVIVRNASDGTIRFRMSGHRGRIHSLTFSPDGRTLLTGDSEGTLKLWSTEVGHELFEIRNPNTNVNKIEFSADGMHLFVHLNGGPNAQTPGQYDDELLIFDANKN